MANYEIDFQVVSQVRDEAANASNVTIALRFRRTDFYYVGWNDLDQERWRLNAENFPNQDTGDIGWNLNYGYSNPLPQNQWREVGRNNFRLPHNEDGSLTINIYGKIYFGVSPGTLEARKTITCTPNNRNVKITRFEQGTVNNTNVSFNWGTSGNIDALHLYDGDTKLREYSVSGSPGSIEYTVTPNRNYRFQIRVKKSGTSLWTNSGFIEYTLGYPTITGDFNLNINSPINLYFSGTTLPSSVYLYVGAKDDNNYFAEKKNIQSSYASITLTPDQKNKVYKLAGLKEWITVVVVQNLHINGVETPYQQYSATMQLNTSDTAPIFKNFSYSNINYAVSNIIGSNKALANIPCMQVQISTTNKAVSSVSSISKYVCSVTNASGFSRTYEALESQGTDVLIDLGGIPNSGYCSISMYAVDSRGIQSSPVVKQNAFEVLDYHVPIASTFSLERQGNFEQEVDLYIKCLISKVSNKNSSFSVSYRKCISGTQSWESWTSIYNISSSSDTTDYIKIINQKSFLSLDRGTSYDFQFKFKDKFSEVVINPTVPQGIAPLSVFEDGVVAINRIPDFNQADQAKLQVGGDILLRKESNNKDVFVAESLESMSTKLSTIEENNSQILSKLNGKIDRSDIVDNLTSSSSTVPLSANQGRVLKEQINGILTIETRDLHGKPWGNDMNVKLAKLGSICICNIFWTGATGTSKSATISEVIIPDGFRPSTPVFATTQNVTSNSTYGASTRIQISSNGKISFVTDNTGMLERHVTFAYSIV